jgi:transposase
LQEWTWAASEHRGVARSSGVDRAQLAKLDDGLKELSRRNEVAWRLMSVPGVGPITALAFNAAIENVERFRRTRDIGAYLALTEKRYQSADTNVGMGISKQGDASFDHGHSVPAPIQFSDLSRTKRGEHGEAQKRP